MAFAQIGPLTTAAEAAATAIGAGILLGSFVLGTISLLRGTPRPILEGRVLTDGYLGGLVGACIALFDLLLRYGA
jgi:hypothetical protein